MKMSFVNIYTPALESWVTRAVYLVLSSSTRKELLSIRKRLWTLSVLSTK